MGRKPNDLGISLPELTFAEAARVLGIDEGAFIHWLLRVAKPSPSRWSEWSKAVKPLPEKLIRLYLTTEVRQGEVPVPAARTSAPKRAARG